MTKELQPYTVLQTPAENGVHTIHTNGQAKSFHTNGHSREFSLGELKTKTFKAGETICTEADPSSRLLIITFGQVALQATHLEKGTVRQLRTLCLGEIINYWILEPTLQTGKTLQAIAKTDVQVQEINLPPKLADRICLITQLSIKRRRAMQQLQLAQFFIVEQRVFLFLAQLATEKGIETEDGIQIDEELRHQEIADKIGTSRESVTRMLAKLKRVNLVTKVRKHKITLNKNYKQTLEKLIPPRTARQRPLPLLI